MRQILLIVHILLGSIWVGGIMFIGWGVFPASLSMTLRNQRQFLIKLMKWTHHFFTLIGCGVIATGILLGTYFGPIKSWQSIWDTNYGNIWGIALMLGIFTLLWGIFVGYREMMIIFHDDYLWQEAENGNKKPLLRNLIRLTFLESFEIAGFLTLIILMVSY